jgi:hypothetical protein
LKRFVAASVIVGAAVCAELLLPGVPLYHTGWYNVALGALIVVAIVAVRRVFADARSTRARLATLAVLLGTIGAGLAGVTNGLFAPDNRNVVGAPGQRVSVESLGTLSFPLVNQDGPATVTLERALFGPMRIGARRRDAGSFMVRTLPRDVVYVEVRDLRGNRLTVTQPQGSAFLSPVLLMQQRQTIAGLDVPFDSFNVPAARRVVKAILFNPEQAAAFVHDTSLAGQGAVLFAADDENDRPLPHGIALSVGGRDVQAANLRLRGSIVSYPQVEVISSPNLAAVLLGALLIVAGLVALFF